MALRCLEREDEAYALFELWRSGADVAELLGPLELLARSLGLAQLIAADTARELVGFGSTLPRSFDEFVRIWNEFVDVRISPARGSPVRDRVLVTTDFTPLDAGAEALAPRGAPIGRRISRKSIPYAVDGGPGSRASSRASSLNEHILDLETPLFLSTASAAPQQPARPRRGSEEVQVRHARQPSYRNANIITPANFGIDEIERLAIVHRTATHPPPTVSYPPRATSPAASVSLAAAAAERAAAARVAAATPAGAAAPIEVEVAAGGPAVEPAPTAPTAVSPPAQPPAATSTDASARSVLTVESSQHRARQHSYAGAQPRRKRASLPAIATIQGLSGGRDSPEPTLAGQSPMARHDEHPPSFEQGEQPGCAQGEEGEGATEGDLIYDEMRSLTFRRRRLSKDLAAVRPDMARLRALTERVDAERERAAAGAHAGSSRLAPAFERGAEDSHLRSTDASAPAPRPPPRFSVSNHTPPTTPPSSPVLPARATKVVALDVSASASAPAQPPLPQQPGAHADDGHALGMSIAQLAAGTAPQLRMPSDRLEVVASRGVGTSLSTSALRSGSARGVAHPKRRSSACLPVSFAGEMLPAVEPAMAAAALKRSGAERLDGKRCFPEHLVGTFSCHGMAPVHGEAVDKINQDCGCFVHPFAWPGQALFAVFDGHGPEGEVVSNAAMNSVFELLADDSQLETEPVKAMMAAFEGAEAHLLATVPDEALHSGACAIVALLRQDRIYVAGAGDCRCVLARRAGASAGGGRFEAVDLSKDHNYENEAECERVRLAGGVLSEAKEPKVDGYFEPARVYRTLEDRAQGPGLAMSRSIGDLDATEVGVVATAEVRVHEIDSERDAFLILASDGVWEFIESDEAVEIVGAIFEKGWSAEAATKHLIARAAVEWMQEEGDYRDDITCIVVYLACRAEMVSMRWEDYGIRDDPDDGRAARLSGSGRHAARPQSEQSQRTLIRVEQPTPSELLAAGKPGAAAPAAPAR